MELTAQACEALAASRAHVAALASDECPHYGISTGFGALATRYIPPSQRAVLVDYLIAAAALVHGLEFATLNIKHFPMFADLEPPFPL